MTNPLLMNFFRLSIRWVFALLLMLHTSPLLAQGKAPVAPPEKSYAMAYLVVVLLIALGLMIVLRGGGRSDEPKLPDLE